MTSQPVDFLEPIKGDLESAIKFYNSWRKDGAAHFEKLFWETIDWIEWNPELFPLKYRRYRRAILRKSYYAVYYVVEPEVTVVVAVLDMRLNPQTIARTLGRRWRSK